MFNRQTVTKKTTIMQTVVEDSNRLSPFNLLLIDDLVTLTTTGSGCWSLLPELLRGYTTNQKSPKHVTILSIDECDKSRYERQRALPVSNVTILTEEDLDPCFEGLDKLFECPEVLIARQRLGGDNVLLIDSITPLLMAATKDRTLEMATKLIARWIYGLADIFSHVLIILHADSFDNYIESSFSSISNAIVDFRLNSTGNFQRIQCPNLKTSPDSIHTFITIRQKHPRTNYKITRRHEHFKVVTTGLTPSYQFIGEDELVTELTSKEINEPKESSNLEAGITFNLNLKEDEVEARNKLVLPYIKKNSTAELGSTSGVGQIVYHYDKFDDFDEDEDPDDDLDF